MKIVFRVANMGNRRLVLPLAEFASPEEAAKAGVIVVSLSRRGGLCNYPLANMDAHAGHAPSWGLDGKAPLGSSSPDASIDTYTARILDEAKVKLAALKVEVTAESKEITPQEAYALFGAASDADEGGEGGEGPGPGKVDWGKYGVN